jgi:transposase
VRAVPVRAAGRNGHAEHDSPTAPVTVGVDTHLDLQVAAVLEHTGRLLGTQAFPASTRGDVALVTWAEGFGPVQRVGIEGTGSYGAGLASFLADRGEWVTEIDRPKRPRGRNGAKSDPLDAIRAGGKRLAVTTWPAPASVATGRRWGCCS